MNLGRACLLPQEPQERVPVASGTSGESACCLRNPGRVCLLPRETTCFLPRKCVPLTPGTSVDRASRLRNLLRMCLLPSGERASCLRESVPLASVGSNTEEIRHRKPCPPRPPCLLDYSRVPADSLGLVGGLGSAEPCSNTRQILSQTTLGEMPD